MHIELSTFCLHTSTTQTDVHYQTDTIKRIINAHQQGIRLSSNFSDKIGILTTSNKNSVYVSCIFRNNGTVSKHHK